MRRLPTTLRRQPARTLQRVRRQFAEGEAIVPGEMSLVLEAAFQRDAEHGGRSVGPLQHLARVVEPNPFDVFLRGEAAGLLEALEQGPGVDVCGSTLSGWFQFSSTNCLTVSTVEAAGEVSGPRLASVKSMQAAASPITWDEASKIGFTDWLIQRNSPEGRMIRNSLD
jgi:hypothetical protein